MPFRHSGAGRGLPGRTGAAVGLALAGIALALIGPAPAQGATTVESPRGKVTVEYVARVTAGIAAGDYAAPDPRTHAVVDIDLFRTFTDCLAEAAHRDSMYPGIDPSEVNACLADYGF